MMNISTKNRDKINSFAEFIVITLLGLLLICLSALLSERNAPKEAKVNWK